METEKTGIAMPGQAPSVADVPKARWIKPLRRVGYAAQASVILTMQLISAFYSKGGYPPAIMDPTGLDRAIVRHIEFLLYVLSVLLSIQIVLFVLHVVLIVAEAKSGGKFNALALSIAIAIVIVTVFFFVGGALDVQGII